MSLEILAMTDVEIATGISSAIADLNKYLAAAQDGGLRVNIDYNTVSSIGHRYGLKVYAAEILRPVEGAL